MTPLDDGMTGEHYGTAKAGLMRSTSGLVQAGSFLRDSIDVVHAREKRILACRLMRELHILVGDQTRVIESHRARRA